MQIKINTNTFFVFDLDDTLYHEIDFLKSAYRHIAGKLQPFTSEHLYEKMYEKYGKGENVFNWILENFGPSIPNIDKDWLLDEYRYHAPQIKLSHDTAEFLRKSKEMAVPAGLMTDGRSITQRNKLKSLGLEDYFNDIIISEEFGSEKPDERNFLYFQKKYTGKDFHFFADNTSKDFIVPSKLGWTTYCIKNSGKHVHSQNLETDPRPTFIVSGFQDLTLIPNIFAGSPD